MTSISPKKLARVDIRDIHPREILLRYDGKEAVFVDEERPGYPLRCTKHLEEWCADIARVIQKNEDSGHLWDTRNNTSFVIPLMPTNHIFEWVTFHPLEDEEDILKVMLIPNNDHLEDEPDFIGLLSEGEGRLSIRQMILNHFEVRIADIDRCSFPGHGITAEGAWQQHLKDTKLSFLDKYFVLKKGKCGWCLLTSRGGDSNYDDLIPGSPGADRIDYKRLPTKNFHPVTSIPSKDEEINAIFD